jgi:hypothetical protein
MRFGVFMSAYAVSFKINGHYILVSIPSLASYNYFTIAHALFTTKKYSHLSLA